MNNIIRKIKDLYPVSDSALKALTDGFEQVCFPAKAQIISAGVFDRNVYFIESGITRSYIQHDGKDITTWFSLEGDAVCGSWDLYRHKAGFEYVETLENTIAYAVSIEWLDELYRSYMDIANWMRILQQENFLRLQDNHICRLSLSAKDRYTLFRKEYPELLQRVNLGYIASFLGVTQQSLSRIRADKLF